MGRRLALLIATYEYQDAGLRRLTAPAHDAESLAAVLQDPDIAGFEVTTLVNEPHHQVGEAIGDLYRDRRRDDLTLLYFTGHGLKDDDGRLYLAMTNTRRASLLFTSLPAEQIDQAMTDCMSRQKVLILDCCYGGAFPASRIAKADAAVHTLERFQGRGRSVLTASDAVQYSFEGDRRSGSAAQSVFTRHLVAGLRDGSADLDGDGDITIDELYSYVHDRVVEEMPQQRPKKQENVEGRIVIARNINWSLPPYLKHALDSPIATDRLAAVDALAHLYRIGNDLVRQHATTQIARLTSDDSKLVSAAATRAQSSLPRLPEADGQAPSSQAAGAPEPTTQETPTTPRVPAAAPARGNHRPAAAVVGARPAPDHRSSGLPPTAGDPSAATTPIVPAATHGTRGSRLLSRTDRAAVLTVCAGVLTLAVVLTLVVINAVGGFQGDGGTVSTGPAAVLTGPAAPIVGVVFSPDGKALASMSRSSGRDVTVWRWNLATGKATATLNVSDACDQMALGPDGKTLASATSPSGGGDGPVRLWEVATGEVTATVAGDGRCGKIAISPDGKVLATANPNPSAGGSRDGPAHLWNAATGKATDTLGAPPDGVVYALAFSPDGGTLATGGNGMVLLTKVPTRNRTAVPAGDLTTGAYEPGLTETQVYDVVFAPDSRHIAVAAGSGGRIRGAQLWDMANGPLDTVTGDIDAVGFGPDGKPLFATIGTDGTVRLWNHESGHVSPKGISTVGKLPGQGGRVNDVAFSPNGKVIATGGQDGKVRLWNTPA